MERRVCLLTAWEGVRPAFPAASCKRGVNRGSISVGARPVKNRRRPVFHDVRFAAGWPRRTRDIAPERPEGGPKALICRVGQLNACFDAAILKIRDALRLHAR